MRRIWACQSAIFVAWLQKDQVRGRPAENATCPFVDPQALVKSDPAIMRDRQRICIFCSQKRRCQHELAERTAGENFREFCPNAYTLDALVQTERTAVPALMSAFKSRVPIDFITCEAIILSSMLKAAFARPYRRINAGTAVLSV